MVVVVVVKLGRRKVSYSRYSAAVIHCRFLQLYILLVNVIILLDDKENVSSPAASHAVDGLTGSRVDTGQSVGLYDFEHRDDHEVMKIMMKIMIYIYCTVL